MRSRGWLVAHPAVWFSVGVLFAGQLPGEALHDRVWLVVLLLLAVLAGRLWEGVRVGGSVDRQVRAVGEPCVICGNDRQPRRRGQGNTVVCIDSECCDWQVRQDDRSNAVS